jgi:hypothetical protein
MGTQISNQHVCKDASQIVVGADFYDTDSTLLNTGAVYLFDRIDSNGKTTTTRTAVEWTEMGKFVAADREAGDQLGASVAIENNICVAGAFADDGLTGSVYVVRTAPDPSKHFPKESFCFAAINTVFVKGKGIIPMHKLEVGDFVQSGDQGQSFSRVLSFMHIDRNAEVKYLQIHMEHNEGHWRFHTITF